MWQPHGPGMAWAVEQKQALPVFLELLLWLSGEGGHIQDLGLDLEAVDGAGL